MNETLKIIAERFSCRAFDDRLPEMEKLEKIALAAVQSPSALNRQPWRIKVIIDKEFIGEMDIEGMHVLSEAGDKSVYERFMDRGGRLFYNAPCMFLILQQSGAEIDTGIVSENISIAAASLGLGSVICGMARIPFESKNGDTFKQRAGFEIGFEFGVSVLVGYAKKFGVPHEPDSSKISFIENYSKLS
ncbi:MAG: nitroreductase family protein [Eubacterium sp.]|jgi:nitroreductase|nr:nitroreductase family protein [Eubacterium sp.]